MSNETPQTGIKTISSFLNSEAIMGKFTQVLGNSGPSFVSSVLAACNLNQDLKKCTTESIYTAALMAATLRLPINPNLGLAYLIPYTKKRGTSQEITECQFQIGYKGFIQLAQRSGTFLTIGATHITDKDVKKGDRLLGYTFEMSEEVGVVVGYAAHFKLLNGFEKTLYMTVDGLKKHGTKYSQSFKGGYGLWKDDFESMATKTVIKLLLSKYAPLSIEMERAVLVDQGIIRDVETNDVEYTDNEQKTLSLEEQNTLKEFERISQFMDKATSMIELEPSKELCITPELLAAYEAKEKQLKTIK